MSTRKEKRASGERAALEARVLEHVLASTSSETRHNIDDYVWVKLTDYGGEVYRKYYQEHGGYAPLLFGHLGYTRFQMRQLMAIFGTTLYNGTPPFEREIILASTAPDDHDNDLLMAEFYLKRAIAKRNTAKVK